MSKPRQIDIKTFLDERHRVPVIDVRSPSEYKKGHIPGSYNLPLFSDDERAIVGTKYTKEGRFSSVVAGLGFVGSKLEQIVKDVNEIAPSKKILVYCWRGGMRSESVSWLLNVAGLNTRTLIGGYKSYRQYLRNFFRTPLKLIVLGGMTGSGKTELLKELSLKNEQVINLEEIANHKGSAFGAIGQNPQPTTEQFENLLFEKIISFHLERRIWVEDESKSIGTIFIPDEIFSQISISPCVVIEIPYETRVNRLVKEYSDCDSTLLISAIDRISKKIGHDNARLAKNALINGNFQKVVELVLLYYDKAYRFGVESKKNKPYVIRFTSDNHAYNVNSLIELIDSHRQA